MNPLDISPSLEPWVFWRIFRFRRALKPVCSPVCPGCQCFALAHIRYGGSIDSFEHITKGFYTP